MITKEKILKKATELFMHYGIKTIKMDDIAKDLSISKRTLYTIFKSKQSLVTAVVKKHVETQRKQLLDLPLNSENAIDKMLETLKIITKMYNKLHKNVFFDLQKFYPETWTIIDNFQDDFIKSRIEQNLIEGKKEGVYRNEIEPQILSSLYSTQLQLFSNQSNFNLDKFLFTDYLIQMFEYHLFGIMSYKGVKYYLNKEKKINI